MTDSRYPELDKLNAISEDKMLIEEFVEFLKSKDVLDCNMSEEDLVFDFFGLDSEKIRAERNDLLNSL